MSEKLLLAIDQGTTSSRAILFDFHGRVMAQHQVELIQYYPQDGWVEHDPEGIWQSVVDCANQVLSHVLAENVITLGISNQRETTIVWERSTGKAIYPAIVWQDRRTASLCEQLKKDSFLEKSLQQKTGLLLDPYFSATKLAWILDNVQGARDMAEQGLLAFGTVDSYLLWRLTEGAVHATDATNAARTLLYNIREGKWDQELLSLFDIPEQVLPEVKDSACQFGVAAASHFGKAIPISSMVGDQQAATIGNACFDVGMAKSTYGTGCFVLVNTGDQLVLSKHRMLSTIAYQLDGKPTYGLEGSIFVAGAAVQWLKEALCFFDKASDTQNMALSVEDNAGVYLVPAFTGLGAPYWDPHARGALLGLTRDTGTGHIVRAALEAVCYQTKDLLLAMQDDCGVDITMLRVDGGMTSNDWLLQFLSDILNIQVDRPACIESSALGAAMLAALGMGEFSNLSEVSSIWQLSTAFKPIMPQQQREQLYKGWKSAVARITTA